MENKLQSEDSGMNSNVRALGTVEPDDYAKAFSPENGEDFDLHVDLDAEPEPEPDVDFGPATGWRPAKCLDALKTQINARWPNRRKASDGMIGDDRHCAVVTDKPSDHCPHVRDGRTSVVTAYDITFDDRPGMCNAHAVVEAIRHSMDPRVKYIISNGKICSSYAVGNVPPWVWRTYPGSNKHTKHAHLSVVSNKAAYDSSEPWVIE